MPLYFDIWRDKMAKSSTEHTLAFEGKLGELTLKFAENPKLATAKDLVVCFCNSRMIKVDKLKQGPLIKQRSCIGGEATRSLPMPSITYIAIKQLAIKQLSDFDSFKRSDFFLF